MYHRAQKRNNYLLKPLYPDKASSYAKAFYPYLVSVYSVETTYAGEVDKRKGLILLMQEKSTKERDAVCFEAGINSYIMEHAHWVDYLHSDGIALNNRYYSSAKLPNADTQSGLKP